MKRRSIACSRYNIKKKKKKRQKPHTEKLESTDKPNEQFGIIFHGRC